MIDSITVPSEVTHMAIDDGGSDDEAPMFSFGVRELQRADLAQRTESPPTRPEPADQRHRGFDPYNSTGSFDRSLGWSRIRKR